MSNKLELLVQDWLKELKSKFNLSEFQFTLVNDVEPKLYVHNLQYSTNPGECEYQVRNRNVLDKISELHESLADAKALEGSSLKVTANLHLEEWSLSFDYRP